MVKMWCCDVCGYLHEGDNPPDLCPKCGAPKDRFELLDEEEAGMMRDAFLTKRKYGQILKRLEEIKEIAEEGIILNLDEGCNRIFTRAKEDIAAIYGMIKDELTGHAQQCIWVKVAKDGELPIPKTEK
ncbi:MAG: rubredoxin [Dethiobacteria bacterium]